MAQRRTAIGVALALTVGIAGCGRLADSPLHIFGKSQEVAVTTTVVDGAEITDSRALIDQIATLSIDPVQGGAIVRATGVAARQGYWDAALIQVPAETPGRLTLAFVAQEAPGTTQVSTQRSREVTVATRVTDAELVGVSQINVTAARNAHAVQR